MKGRWVKSNAFWLVMSLVICLVSALGSSFVQSSGGTVTIKDMRWETSSGSEMSALLFKPANATAENPAPGVIVSHGWFNNREMQDPNYVELARRGFVVISIDMQGHGNSETVPGPQLLTNGIGMYNAVELMADLPYVDATRIGVTGHSNGAWASNLSVDIDNTVDTPLIASVLLVSNDANYADPDTGEYFNKYGARDVGIFHTQYDEFFYRTYSAEGEVLTAPRDYLKTDNAQSFLNFGAAKADFDGVREANKVYTEKVDGQEAMRVIYSAPMIHPWATFSSTEARDVVSFFDQSLGAPTAIDPANQTWQWKEFFNALGLIGFAIFLVAFARALLSTRTFAGLKVAEPIAAAPLPRRGHIWFWTSMIGFAIVSAWTYVALSPIAGDLKPAFMLQDPPFFIGLWAAVNGLVALVYLTIFYLVYGRKNGVSLKSVGLLPGWRNFGMSVVLSAIVVTAAFGIVFVVDYFLKTDFRLWVLAIKAFGPDKIGIAWLYLPLFLLYFVANSIALNSFSRFSIKGKEWINTAVLALFNSLGPIVLVIAQYTTFFTTGFTIDGFGGIFSIWLFPVVVILAVAAVVSRKIYRASNNPYIGGFIMAAVVTMMSVSNTLTVG